VVLRHGKARSRRSWSEDDRLRPLLQVGEEQAQRLVPLLAAFDVTAAHTSSSTRCVQTVLPYVDTTGWPVKTYDELSEEGASVPGIVDLVDDLLDGGEGAVLCSHRPVLPSVLDAVGVPEVRLEPGSMLVVHHRKGRVVATEVVTP
jgi:8-oxo-dGTP diphosphatase